MLEFKLLVVQPLWVHSSPVQSRNGRLMMEQTLVPHMLVLLVLSQTARHKMAATWQLKNCCQSFYFLSFLKKRRKKVEKSFLWNRLVMLCWLHCRDESHFEVWLIVRVWVTRWYPWITCFCFFRERRTEAGNQTSTTHLPARKKKSVTIHGSWYTYNAPLFSLVVFSLWSHLGFSFWSCLRFLCYFCVYCAISVGLSNV